MKRTYALILSAILLISAFGYTSFAETLSDDIVILYTNDVHTYIDGVLSYDVIGGIKNELEKEYKYVFLADAGDHIQGTAYGSVDKGESIIKMMNMADYDVATLGNHEFDYDMEGCHNIIELADYPYLSANLYHEKDGVRGENMLDSYKIFDCGEEKLAVIGITTPETIHSSTPAYFQDENGEYIYGISAGEDGSLLQADVQKAIDDAKKEGATKIVALGHLGIDPSSENWTSEETIGNICGIDAFIDGHSHSIIESKIVTDKEGHEVVLTQTGQYFERIGMMHIDAQTGKITTDFIEIDEILSEDGNETKEYKLVSDLYTQTDIVSDVEVKEFKENRILAIEKELGKKIGETNVVLDNYDSDGKRLVRSQETNSGNFAADAIYYLFDNMEMDVDVAVVNGGCVRNTAITGEISYKTCKDMHTFGNVICLLKVSGQQLLDALEWGARYAGEGETGGFLQTSGVTYKIDTSIKNTLKESEVGSWVEQPEEYRVYDVEVYNRETDTYDALDVNAFYNMAGHNYILRNLGDGYEMFDGAVNVLDFVMEDYLALANYVKAFENSTVCATNSPLLKKYPSFKLDYGTVYGSGRIEIVNGKINADEFMFNDVDSSSQYFDDIKYVAENGILQGSADKKFMPSTNITRAMIISILYRLEGEPPINKSIPFADVDMGGYYADAVNWAKQNNIVNGVSENEFQPDADVTNEQISAIIYRYAQYKNYDVNSDFEEINLDEISLYAKEPIKYMLGKNILENSDFKNGNPKEFVNRAECAKILRRFIEGNK